MLSPSAESAIALRSVAIPAEIAAITALASAGQGGVAPPPWSAAHAFTNLYSPKSPLTATVAAIAANTASGASFIT